MRNRQDTELRPLVDHELEAVNGGFMQDFANGSRGCTTVLNPADPRFAEWIRLPNGWLPGGSQR